MITETSTDSQYEIGKLHAERGDFLQALPLLKRAGENFLAARDWAQFLKCQTQLLRIHAEREEWAEISQIKDRLQDLVLNQGFELTSRTYYTLAVCASYKDQPELALDYLQKALALAVSADNKEDICYALVGLSYTYVALKPSRIEEAIKELENLKVFFQVYDLPELKHSALLLQARILQGQKRYEEALEVCWQAYSEVKKTKSIFTVSYIFAMMGNICLEKGDRENARMNLEMAQKLVDPQNQIRLARMIERLLEKVGAVHSQKYDLIFDEENHQALERTLGKIDLKNQFILMDLLRLFMKNPGQVFSKESLFETIWKESYDPAAHDNKIYVTIKRLRRLIEPDFDRPKYIFRGKNGYYMNKAARLQVTENFKGDHP